MKVTFPETNLTMMTSGWSSISLATLNMAFGVPRPGPFDRLTCDLNRETGDHGLPARCIVDLRSSHAPEWLCAPVCTAIRDRIPCVLTIRSQAMATGACPVHEGD